ncbi:hypothetical protein DFP72DRAFT_848321 [Ephemerocybe angulata]|uniref:Uncharacterized protein n=1 Tax=Ephemerocybe angulata TaxID=980116 RepID=A0A8H6HX55_9AGAR|nr:hypothetical protein DFP72DRAFT_848321 [Tulosesus angulatus]
MYGRQRPRNRRSEGTMEIRNVAMQNSLPAIGLLEVMQWAEGSRNLWRPLRIADRVPHMSFKPGFYQTAPEIGWQCTQASQVLWARHGVTGILQYGSRNSDAYQKWQQSHRIRVKHVPPWLSSVVQFVHSSTGDPGPYLIPAPRLVEGCPKRFSSGSLKRIFRSSIVGVTGAEGQWQCAGHLSALNCGFRPCIIYAQGSLGLEGFLSHERDYSERVCRSKLRREAHALASEREWYTAEF